MRIGAAALGLCLGAMSMVPALAQQPTQAQVAAIRSSCKADFKAYCASTPQGGMAALSCLQQNVAKLSPPCQQAVTAANAPANAPTGAATPAPVPSQPPPTSPRVEAHILRQYCAADYRKLCAGVRPRGGAGIACLKDHAQALSPDCQQALMSARAPQ
jgi:hypothetical protein